MAARYWVGGQDGDTKDWTNTSNWSATRGGSSGVAAPATNDAVEVITRNKINGSDQASVDLSSLVIELKPGGSIGADTALIIAVSGAGTPALKFSGQGTCNIQAGTAGIDKLIFEGLGLSLTGGTTIEIEGGTHGHLDIGASAVVTNIKAGATTGTIAYNATAVTSFEHGGAGLWACYRTVTTGRIAGVGAALRLVDAAAIGTKMHVHGGSKFVAHNYGTIADIEVWPDAVATNDGSEWPTTISAGTKWPGGSYFENDVNVLPTVLVAPGK